MYRFDYLTEKSIEMIDAARDRFSSKSAKQRKLYLERFLPDFIYNTNAIDGNRLSAKDTFNIINGKEPRGKKHEEILEVKNMQAAFSFIMNKKSLGRKIIKQVHLIMMKDTGLHVGSFRDHNVEIYGSRHMPCDYLLLELEIDKLTEWYNENDKKVHPVEMASVLHRRFTAIHPFFDGNGRMARLLTNYVLWQKGYPLFVFLHKGMKKYFSALEVCHLDHLEEPFVLWFAEEYIKQNRKLS